MRKSNHYEQTQQNHHQNILIAPFVIGITLPLESIVILFDKIATLLDDMVMRINLPKFKHVPLTEERDFGLLDKDIFPETVVANVDQFLADDGQDRSNTAKLVGRLCQLLDSSLQGVDVLCGDQEDGHDVECLCVGVTQLYDTKTQNARDHRKNILGKVQSSIRGSKTCKVSHMLKNDVTMARFRGAPAPKCNFISRIDKFYNPVNFP